MASKFSLQVPSWSFLLLILLCVPGNQQVFASSSSWEQLKQPVFNVIKFGAIGDGVTKDTLAIQAAFKVR